MNNFKVELTEKHTFMRRWFNKNGIKNPGVRAIFNSYVKGLNIPEVGKIENFDEFKKNVNIELKIDTKSETFTG